MIRLALFALALLAFGTPVGPNAQGSPRRKAGGTLSAHSRKIDGYGYRFRLTFQSESKTRFGAMSYWGLADPNKPEVHLVGLTGTFRNEPLDGQESCYAGLYDVRKVSLRKTKPGACLVLEGGETATHYTAEIEFDGIHVTKRVVRLGEFRKEIYEQTEYHYAKDSS